MNERYLIINADDFGLCESMNQAVQELFRLGACLLYTSRCV